MIFTPTLGLGGLNLVTLGFGPSALMAHLPDGVFDMAVIFPVNTDKLVVPELRQIEFSMRRLQALGLPDGLEIEIEPFNGIEPVAPVKEISQLQFVYAEFSNLVQNVIDGKITSFMFYKKPAEIEALEWNKTKDEAIEELEDQQEMSFDSEASRGLVGPSGKFARRMAKQETNLKKSLSKLNAQFSAAQKDEAVENIEMALDAGNKAESAVRNTFISKQQVDLEAVDFLLDVNFQVFALRVSQFNGDLDIFRTKHSAWIEELKGQLLKLQEIELDIRKKTLNAQDEQTKLDLLKLSIDYLRATKNLDEIELETFVLESEQEKNKLLLYRAEIDKFGALVNSNVATFNLYRAKVEREVARVDKYSEEVRVAESNLRLQDAKTRLGEAEGRAKIEVAESNLTSQREKLRAARQRLEDQIKRIRATEINYDSNLANYSESLNTWLQQFRNIELDRLEDNQSIRNTSLNRIGNRSRQNVSFLSDRQEVNRVTDLANITADAIELSSEISAATNVASELVHRITQE